MDFGRRLGASDERMRIYEMDHLALTRQLLGLLIPTDAQPVNESFRDICTRFATVESIVCHAPPDTQSGKSAPPRKKENAEAHPYHDRARHWHQRRLDGKLAAGQRSPTNQLDHLQYY